MWQMMMTLCTLLIGLFGAATLGAYSDDPMEYEGTGEWQGEGTGEGTGGYEYSKELPELVPLEANGAGKGESKGESRAQPGTPATVQGHISVSAETTEPVQMRHVQPKPKAAEAPGSSDNFWSALSSLRGAVNGWEKVYNGLNAAAGMMVHVAGQLHNGLMSLPGVGQGESV